MAWGLGSLAVGAALLATVPQDPGGALGPRLAMGAFLATLGVVLALGAFAADIRARTARVEGSGGGCPVGATCACGHFNLKPRRQCRHCGAATVYT